jgi:hypothetical protein
MRGVTVALVPRWRLSLKVRAAWTIALSAYSGLVGLALILDRTLDKDTWRWVHSDKFLITIVAILTLATFADAAKRTLHRVRASRVEQHSVQIRNQLSAVIVTVAKLHTLEIADLGCGLFLIQPRGIRRPTRLVRTQRVRIIDDLHESAVEFTKGKGTVGQCWEHQRPAYHNWGPINAQLHSKPDAVKKFWDQTPEKLKRGFTETEFVSLLGKYSEVLAVPVMIAGKFEGCLALDLRWNKNGHRNRSYFDNEQTEKVLGLAAQTLVPLLKK